MILRLLLTASLVLTTAFAGQNPANPNTNLKTRKLLTWLAGQQCKDSSHLVIGETMGLSQADTTAACSLFYNKVYQQSGKNFALIGFDIEAGFSLPESSYDVSFHENWFAKCSLHAAAGGIITLGWHPHNPWNGGNVFDMTGTGNHAILQLLDTANSLGKKWQKKLDAIAAIMQRFEAMGVPILWRPLHEMNGNWFWWGSIIDNNDYIAVWKHMFDYFCKVKGLDNILWVYSPNEGSGSLNKYPGSSYVDITGVDFYPYTSTFGTNQAYTEMLNLGKVMALAEYGFYGTGSNDNLNVLNSIKSSNSRYAYMMYWNDWSAKPFAITSNLNTNAFMNDPWVVPLDKMDFESADTSLQPCAAPPRVIDWTFETNGDSEGWSAWFQSSIAVSNGLMQVTVEGADPILLSPAAMNIDAGQYRYLRVIMKNSTTDSSAHVYFINNSSDSWSGTKGVGYRIKPNDTGYTSYIVDMSECPLWNGNIHQLRLDPVEKAAVGAKAYIDRITLLKQYATPADVAQMDVVNSSLTVKPNPFNPTTQLFFSLPTSNYAVLTVYDASGKQIGTLVDGKLTAGHHSAEWNGSGMASGVYVFQLKIGNKVETKRAVLTR